MNPVWGFPSTRYIVQQASSYTRHIHFHSVSQIFLTRKFYVHVSSFGICNTFLGESRHVQIGDMVVMCSIPHFPFYPQLTVSVLRHPSSSTTTSSWIGPPQIPSVTDIYNLPKNTLKWSGIQANFSTITHLPQIRHYALNYFLLCGINI